MCIAFCLLNIILDFYSLGNILKIYIYLLKAIILKFLQVLYLEFYYDILKNLNDIFIDLNLKFLYVGNNSENQMTFLNYSLYI